MSQTTSTTDEIRSQSYFTKIWRSASTTFEGLAITFANMLKKPVTIEYPDRLPHGKKLWEVLPDRTRGFLEVDMDICTACTLCETNCPIDCIQILIEKRENEETGKNDRGMFAFDIDLGKCMYCGLCVEPCPTGAIRMTTQFEGADKNLETMVFRFIPLSGFVIPYKAPKGQRVFETPEHGEIARETIGRMRQENHLLFDFIRSRQTELLEAQGEQPEVDPLELKTSMIMSILKKDDKESLFQSLREVMADTDCGACTLEGAADDWDCDGYSRGLVNGETGDVSLCEPGGDETKEDIELVFKLWNDIP